MRRYSMENRLTKLEKLYTKEEKYQILYRQLIKKETLREIYQDYKKNICFEYFKTIPSKLFYDKELLSLVLRKLATKTAYEDAFRLNKRLGQKEVSYWKNEEEVLFKPITKEDLSEEELSIYLSND